MNIIGILFYALVFGLLIWICYCAYSYSKCEHVTIDNCLDRELIIGNVYYDIALKREVLYCGDNLYTDNNIYAVVVYTEENVVHVCHTLRDSLLILDKQE